MSTPPPNYADYLRIHDLLQLQSGLDGGPDGDELVPDELLFIVVHQVYELWFKMVLRELREAVTLLGEDDVPEEQVSHVVSHLDRVNQILRHAVDQFHIMETLTPQDFLGFRDKLTPASGFQSAQVRELEIRLGLNADQRERYGKVDAIEHLKKVAKDSKGMAAGWTKVQQARLEAAQGATLRNAVQRWLFRTPIEGSSPQDPGDAAVVDRFLTDYQAALDAYYDQQQAHLTKAGLGDPAEIAKRFDASRTGARAFMSAADIEEGAERTRIRRVRAALLFIEHHRALPLLAWPRLLIDTVVELEEQIVLWRHRHARMVERIIGRRVGTGGSSGVDYLDRTTKQRIFTELWTVRSLQLPKHMLPEPRNRGFYLFREG